MDEFISSWQEVSWHDICGQVKIVNKELTNLINKVSPNKNLKLIKVSYCYGEHILKDGILQLPDNRGHTIPIDVTDLKLKAKLDYSAIPLFLTLKNCNEVFIDTGSRIIPLNLFYPGSMLGLFETMDFLYGRQSNPLWSVTSGARSIFMLPKINKLAGFKRLRLNYGLSSTTKIRNISDHWDVFKQISNHRHFNQPWKNEVLFFTKDWFVNNHNDPAWVALRQYFYKQAWHQAQFAIGKIELSLCWESFVDAISSMNLRPTPYLSDQIKHIMLICAGKWPGFRPADNTEQVAPIKGIQEAFMNVYQLKQHLPTIMHASTLHQENSLPVYYSLAYPTLLEGSPRNESSATIMLTLRDIKLYIKIFAESLNEKSKIKNDFLSNIDFSYFHVEPDKYQEILSSKKIPETDHNFLNGTEQYKDSKFCYTSPFWRGCIKIATKDI